MRLDQYIFFNELLFKNKYFLDQHLAQFAVMN